MTEYISIDAKQAFLLPTEVSLPAGSLIEPLMMAMHAISKARLDWGKNLIILGGGAMGQIILKLARQYPLGKIVVVEPVAAKREMAKRFGADVVLDPRRVQPDDRGAAAERRNGVRRGHRGLRSRGSAQTALNIVARAVRSSISGSTAWISTSRSTSSTSTGRTRPSPASASPAATSLPPSPWPAGSGWRRS